jgi:hypothetical protein
VDRRLTQIDPIKQLHEWAAGVPRGPFEAGSTRR